MVRRTRRRNSRRRVSKKNNKTRRRKTRRIRKKKMRGGTEAEIITRPYTTIYEDGRPRILEREGVVVERVTGLPPELEPQTAPQHEPEPVPAALPEPAAIQPPKKLSIQMHEFALFVHYQLTENPNFTFYIQPMPIMRDILYKTYGEIVRYPQRYKQTELYNIKMISGGKYPYEGLEEVDGNKIPFEQILQRYNGIVPKLYLFERVGNSDSFKNNYGFQLLDKMEYGVKIHGFYNVVRKYFCKIPKYGRDQYIIDLKKEYPEQNWGEFGSMASRFNFEILDALNFLEFMIKNTGDDSKLRRLVQKYVDLFSVKFGDVRHCPTGLNLAEGDLEGTYMIVKLKDSTKDFGYDNTEMVVHTCNFELGIPAQYHIGIMRNPSDLMDYKFRKIFSSEKYDAIVRLNTESRMF